MTDLTPAAIAEGERLLSAEIAAFNALIQAENAANMKTDDPLYIAYTDARDAYRSWCDGNIRRLLTAARDAARYREALEKIEAALEDERLLTGVNQDAIRWLVKKSGLDFEQAVPNECRPTIRAALAQGPKP